MTAITDTEALRADVLRLVSALVECLHWHEAQDDELSKIGSPASSPARMEHREEIDLIKEALGVHLERIETEAANRRIREEILEHQAAIVRLESQLTK